MRYAIELIRVSTEQQAASDRASIPAQRAVNQRTAQAYHLQIIKTIQIVDVSGAAVLKSPGMQELLRLIDDPEIIGVVTREFSRLMRPEDLSDFYLLQEFANTNTQLYLPDGPIDFGSKNGRLIGGIRALVAGNERSEILERMWSSKESKRRAGGFAQSYICLPYGVAFDGQWSYTPDAEKVREAFRLLLAGQLSYCELGRQVGITPTNLRVILRNPIYTGWRVIDKRRDTSARARRTKADGRQGDRPKIKRAPEDVIRIKVIDEPLISEVDFNKAQQLMDTKKTRHWRTQERYTHRFLFNGFLTCSLCGELIYTAWQRDDYYVCKARRKGCTGHFMRRDILDPQLDDRIASELTDPQFIGRVVETWTVRQTNGTDQQAQRGRETQLNSLQAKRGRVVDMFAEGVIDRVERESRIADIERDMERVSDLILRQPEPAMSVEALARTLAVFQGWKVLNREDKRRILRTSVLEIRVADYQVEGLYLFGRSNEISPTDKVALMAPQFVPLEWDLRAGHRT